MPLTISRQSPARSTSFNSSLSAISDSPRVAVARRELDQGVEIGLLAFEPAVEGADGCADLVAQRLDRQFGEAARPQHFGAGLQQRKRHLAASLLPRRRDAGKVENLSRSDGTRHPTHALASPGVIIIMIIRIIDFRQCSPCRGRGRETRTGGSTAVAETSGSGCMSAGSDKPFGGTIGKTVAGLQAVVAAGAKPPAGAPNILVVLFDDVGFSDFGCYGSPIKTPTIDRLAAEGLRYQRLPHHRDVLDHARGAVDRAQPSFRRRRLPCQFRQRLSRLSRQDRARGRDARGNAARRTPIATTWSANGTSRR